MAEYFEETRENIFSKIYGFFNPRRMMPWNIKIPFWALPLMGAAAYGLYFLLARDMLKSWTFLLWFFNIGVHEAGHPIFSFISGGNKFWTIAGGCLTELLVPLTAFLFFIRRGKPCQAYFCFAWLGFSFYSVGRYALSTSLPEITLIGGTESDWEYLHEVFGTIAYDVTFGHALYAVGAAVFVFGVYAFFYYFRRMFSAPLYPQDGRGYE